MNSYIDVRLKPDAELREAELSSKVFTKFHKALVTLGTNQIGISFPLVSYKLGQLFRIHSNQGLLIDLQSFNWLGSLSGYCQVGEILTVPEQAKHRVVSAKRGNLSTSKLRRLVARGTIDKDGEKRYKIKMLSQGFDNAYLDLFSRSTGQTYRKFFEFSEIKQEAVKGTFDSYGLSKSATVPWF